MRKAIDFAREIVRKKQVVRGCKSASLHRDYQKSVDRSVRELRYYCKEKGLNYRKIMVKAYNEQ